MQQQLKEIIECAISGNWMLKGNLGGEIDHYEAETNSFAMKDGNSWVKPPVEVIFMDKTFWESIGKEKNWSLTTYNRDIGFDNYITFDNEIIEKAMYFHNLNLTSSLEEAVSFLYEQIKK